MRSVRRSANILPRSYTLPSPRDRQTGVASCFVAGIPWIEQDPYTTYNFVRKLGSGRYATTYLVQNRKTGRELACKQIGKGNPDFDMDRINREIKLQGTLSSHSNVATLEEVWEDNQNVFMVMELCRGGELFDLIVEQGHCSQRDAAAAMRVVLQVIQHCHTHNVLHRDIKPENFLLKDHEGRLEKKKLRAIDFGVSCFLESGELAYDIVGSAMYIAPENLQGSGYSYEADLWSAGVMLYTMLSGMPPFWGDTDEEVCWRVLNEPIDLITDPWPLISDEGKDLVSRLLERDPQRRLSVCDALHHPWLHGLTAPSSQPLNLLVADRLRAVVQLGRLPRLLLNLVAGHLPKSRTGHLEHLFNELDMDGDGKVSVEELQTGLSDMGKELSLPEVQELMAAMDVGGHNSLSFRQFLAGALDKRALLDPRAYSQLAQTLRADQAGDVTMDNLAAALEDLAIDVDRSELLRLCQDVNGPIEAETISFTAIQRLLQQCSPPAELPLSPTAPASSRMTTFGGLHTSLSIEGPASPPETTAKPDAQSQEAAEGTQQEPKADSQASSAPSAQSGCSLQSSASYIDVVPHGSTPSVAVLRPPEGPPPRAPRYPIEVAADKGAFPPRGGSPELSRSFFFHARADEEKPGGRKSAGPIFPSGASPPRSLGSELSASWHPCSRGGSPVSAKWTSGNSDVTMGTSPEGAINQYGAPRASASVMGSSPTGSNMSSEGGFYSGGVLYWPAERAAEDCDDEEEDSDALFGAALVAHKLQRSNLG